MTSPRERIFARLKSAPKRPAPVRPDWNPPAFGANAKAKFIAMLDASHAEIHEVTADNWPERLRSVLAAKGVKTLLVARSAEARLGWGEAGPRLVAYDRAIEEMKDVLVIEADAALTTAKGGIAQTGSVVLWPTPDEPRLMSLLPPIHVVLVDEASITDSLAETMRAQGWAGSMPTNAVLVSGPSKTADIEQTLAYGVHGPKELVVMIMERAS